MDLWTSYKNVAFGDFNAKRLLLSTGDRHHTSLNMVQEKGVGLDPNRAGYLPYSESRRYVIARNVTHDLLISVYDVNTATMLVARLTTPPRNEDWSTIVKRLSSLKNPNVEIRVIGLQNGSSDMLSVFRDLQKNVKGRLMEVDLFGSDTRQIVFDLKTGVSYNLLPLNRLYRPGELVCQVTKEEYEKTRSNLVFK